MYFHTTWWQKHTYNMKPTFPLSIWSTLLACSVLNRGKLNLVMKGLGWSMKWSLIIDTSSGSSASVSGPERRCTVALTLASTFKMSSARVPEQRLFGHLMFLLLGLTRNRSVTRIRTSSKKTPRSISVLIPLILRAAFIFQGLWVSFPANTKKVKFPACGLRGYIPHVFSDMLWPWKKGHGHWFLVLD